MIKHKFIIALFTLCYLLTACVAEDLQGPVAGAGEGYLVLQVGSVSAEVQSAPLTKATTTLEELGVTLPSENEFTITIKDSNGSTVKTGTYGELKQSSSVVLAVGTYKIEASNGSNDSIQSDPYFYASSDITIESLKSTNCPLKPSLGNALLVPVVDETLKKHYTSWSLEVSVGTESETLASSTKTNKLYVKQGSPVTVTFSGTNLINGQTSKTATVTNSAQPCTQYVIQCNPENLPSFTLETSATAQHTKDSEENLNGTQVVLRVDTLTGAPTALITGWQARLYKSDGTVVRTFSLSDIPSSENEYVMNTEGDWPYLPQGEYTLRSQLSLKTGDQTTENVSTVVVPAPTFTVSASAYTSYNKLDESAEEANKWDGSKIYAMKSVPTISDDLLNNGNYEKSATLTLDGNIVTEPDSVAQPWGSHELEATYAFDGVLIKSGKETYHVTGIPYSFNFYKNETNLKNSDWKGVYKFNKADKCGIRYKDTSNDINGYLISPGFYLPRKLLINYTLQAQYYVALGANDAKKKQIELHIGITNTNSQVSSSPIMSILTGDNIDTNEKHSDYIGSLEMDTTNKFISFHHNNASPGWLVWCCLCVYNFRLEYE